MRDRLDAGGQRFDPVLDVGKAGARKLTANSVRFQI
jgi:hypothetical protein